jgi:hypothetical protein
MAFAIHTTLLLLIKHIVRPKGLTLGGKFDFIIIIEFKLFDFSHQCHVILLLSKSHICIITIIGVVGTFRNVHHLSYRS